MTEKLQIRGWLIKLQGNADKRNQKWQYKIKVIPGMGHACSPGTLEAKTEVSLGLRI
jgi:hypothetical protein